MMKADINYHIFRQTIVDSGELTQLGAVARQFPNAGQFLGTVLYKEKPVGRFYLSVDAGCLTTQLNVDLATVAGVRGIGTLSQERVIEPFVVRTEGSALFYVSRGPGGFAVTLTKFDRGNEEPVEVFDSRALKQGELFAVTLIRPGRYKVSNLNTGATGEIVVAYPRARGDRMLQDDPITIQCIDRGFDPSSIHIDAAQGQAYLIQTRMPAQIRIELVVADDGPP
jgi:hypothetical protein